MRDDQLIRLIMLENTEESHRRGLQLIFFMKKKLLKRIVETKINLKVELSTLLFNSFLPTMFGHWIV
jgi:hypothetical protein